MRDRCAGVWRLEESSNLECAKSKAGHRETRTRISRRHKGQRSKGRPVANLSTLQRSKRRLSVRPRARCNYNTNFMYRQATCKRAITDSASLTYVYKALKESGSVQKTSGHRETRTRISARHPIGCTQPPGAPIDIARQTPTGAFPLDHMPLG
jgi:hypothetical protein